MNKHVQSALEGWRALADRQDLVGKDVEFRNDILGEKTTGKLLGITLEGLHVTLHRDGAHDIRFKIEEERDPCQIGKTIFCDLDDNYRQIKIVGLVESTTIVS
ncbi:MAG: hypothetical protein WAX80_02065 [Minisyncoccia bacterium]